jgi:hypothetical protein
MFQDNGRKETISNVIGNSDLHYRIYSYIATFGIGGMINQRIKIASQWLDQPSSILSAPTFYEADQSIHRQQYDLMITDNDSYYKLIEHLPAFKIKIEKDFFSNSADPLLSAKPLYYHPQKNTVFIREQSAHNSRFLYEILKIALTPPVIIIRIPQKTGDEVGSDFKQLRHAIHTIFPYIKLYEERKNSVYSDPIRLDDTPVLTHDVYARDERGEVSVFIEHKLIDYFWKINILLEKKGYLSLYNDKQEILRSYQQAN